MIPSLGQKSAWIAKQTGFDQDDIMDMLLGTILYPEDDVNQVLMLAQEYDSDMLRNS